VAVAGARRESVVLPAPETPAKSNARPSSTALAAWKRPEVPKGVPEEEAPRRTVL